MAITDLNRAIADYHAASGALHATNERLFRAQLAVTAANEELAEVEKDQAQAQLQFAYAMRLLRAATNGIEED